MKLFAGRETDGSGSPVRPGPCKLFPPGPGQVYVPVRSRRTALTAISLYGPSRPRAVRLHGSVWWLVRLLGPRILPGSASVPDLPVDPSSWDRLVEVWTDGLGVFDDVVLLRRVQSDRSGFMVLILRRGSPIAFVKVREEETQEARAEVVALTCLADLPPSAFVTPRILLSGSAGGYHYVAQSPLPGRHRPARRFSLPDVCADIQRGLAGFPVPAHAEPHWVPMHGDLTPWNLRSLSDGRIVLIDWESAAWGPPRADEVLFRCTDAVLRGGRPTSLPGAAEAIAYWSDVISDRNPSDDRDRALKTQSLAVLDRMGDR